MDEVDASKWIPANEALSKYEKDLGGRGAAKETLAEYLRDGGLKAMAAEAWVSEEPVRKNAWKNAEERATAVTNTLIKPVVFQSSKRWTLDKSDWRWPHNKISVTFRRKPIKRHMMAGISFYKADLIKITGAPDPTSGGSPGKKEAWVTYWNALIAIAHDQRLNHDCFPTQTSLRKEILEEYLCGLSDKSIKTPTRQIWEKYCKS